MDTERRRKEFFAMYLVAEPAVHRFLRLLVHDHRVFEDVCQAVALRLWEVFDAYEPSRPFDVWACGVAINVVNELRRSDRRFGRLLPPGAVAALAEGSGKNPLNGFELADQLEALKICLETLPPRSKELIVKRYYEELPVDEVALQTNRPLQGTYKALQRVLKQLAECVRERLAPLAPAEEI